MLELARSMSERGKSARLRGSVKERRVPRHLSLDAENEDFSRVGSMLVCFFSQDFFETDKK